VSSVGPSPYRAHVPEPIVYPAHERPDVKVLWEGAWCPGELRMQRQDGAGQWLAQVQYRRPGELSSHIDDFRPRRSAQTPWIAARAHLARTGRPPP
jgi:hypothetical protein